jgi:hypothetical protein
LEVTVRQPTGIEDLHLQEVRDSDAALSLLLVSNLAQAVDGSAIDWHQLTISDHEALLLLILRALVGDLIEADTLCRQPDCGSHITISFGILAYISYCRVHMPRDVAAEDNGWFSLRTEPIRFRLPSACDVAALTAAKRPQQQLTRLCIEPETLPTRTLRRVLGAMAALAPTLSGDLKGKCPECGSSTSVYFDVRRFVLAELRSYSRRVYEDVHLLARNYQWSEESILTLPRNRRILYAEMLQERRVES